MERIKAIWIRIDFILSLEKFWRRPLSIQGLQNNWDGWNQPPLTSGLSNIFYKQFIILFNNYFFALSIFRVGGCSSLINVFKSDFPGLFGGDSKYLHWPDLTNLAFKIKVGGWWKCSEMRQEDWWGTLFLGSCSPNVENQFQGWLASTSLLCISYPLQWLHIIDLTKWISVSFALRRATYFYIYVKFVYLLILQFYFKPPYTENWLWIKESDHDMQRW